jgi:hypothetical protein
VIHPNISVGKPTKLQVSLFTLHQLGDGRGDDKVGVIHWKMFQEQGNTY